MEPIISTNNIIYFNKSGYQKLNDHLASSGYSKLLILVDENTETHCLQSFLDQLKFDSNFINVLKIKSGEEHKNIKTCSLLWHEMANRNADRNSLLINLGGGVITDMGGFVASTFKRGIDFINIPTSLLAMVDAAIGGKTGIDLGNLKNQIGIISNPKMILVDTHYLKTLPENQLNSGYAEMLKHGLIYDNKYWNELATPYILKSEHLDQLIYKSVQIKNSIVTQDPNENGLRKILNFGHTIGHAIESHYLNDNDSLLHGEAIAIGMIIEAYISSKILGLSEEQLVEIKTAVLNTFKKVVIPKEGYLPIMDLMKYDKKNSHGKVKYVLLNSIGKAKIDCELDATLVEEGFDFYNS